MKKTTAMTALLVAMTFELGLVLGIGTIQRTDYYELTRDNYRYPTELTTSSSQLRPGIAYDYGNDEPTAVSAKDHYQAQKETASWRDLND